MQQLEWRDHAVSFQLTTRQPHFVPPVHGTLSVGQDQVKKWRQEWLDQIHVLGDRPSPFPAYQQVAAAQLILPVWKCRQSSASYSDPHSNIRSSEWDTRPELHPLKPQVCRGEGASSDAPRSLRDTQVHRWVVRPLQRQPIRQTGRRPISPWAGMSIMAYGSVREITSCMMMEKLKTSPANEPPRTGFLKSSGAVHSSSERHREGDTDREGERQVGRQLLYSMFMFWSSSATGLNRQFHFVSIGRVKNSFQTSHPVGPQEPWGSESEGSWEVHSQWLSEQSARPLNSLWTSDVHDSNLEDEDISSPETQTFSNDRSQNCDPNFKCANLNINCSQYLKSLMVLNRRKMSCTIISLSLQFSVQQK